MQKLVIVFAIFCMSCSCKVTTTHSTVDPERIAFVLDSLDKDFDKQLQLLIYSRDMAILERNEMLDSMFYYKNRADSILSKKYVADYKLIRIQHYIDICKREANKKYLYGWIRRVLEN